MSVAQTTTFYLNKFIFTDLIAEKPQRHLQMPVRQNNKKWPFWYLEICIINTYVESLTLRKPPMIWWLFKTHRTTQNPPTYKQNRTLLFNITVISECTCLARSTSASFCVSFQPSMSPSGVKQSRKPWPMLSSESRDNISDETSSF